MHASANVKQYIGIWVCVCGKTMLLPHYPVSSSPTLMRNFTIKVVIKVKLGPKYKKQTHKHKI